MCGGHYMIKIIACMVILGASTMAGFIYSDRLKFRVFQLNEINGQFINFKMK